LILRFGLTRAAVPRLHVLALTLAVGPKRASDAKELELLAATLMFRRPVQRPILAVMRRPNVDVIEWKTSVVNRSKDEWFVPNSAI
jgi:hypothetical protein